MTVLSTVKNYLLYWGKNLMAMVTGIIVLAVCFTLYPIANAATNSSVSVIAVSPPTFDLSANPGDLLNESIKVDNTTSSQQNIVVSLENFVPLGTEGQVNVTNQANQYSLISWIKVTPTSASIPPEGSQIFNYSINVPQNAEPGGRFGSIVFSTAPSSSANGSSVTVTQRIGDLVLLRIAGQADENAVVRSFKANTNDKQYNNDISLTALIANTGNVQVKPIGDITISNMYNHQVASLRFPSEYILPGASRTFATPWKHGFLFGQYKANMTVLYGLSNKILSVSTSFTVIPWHIIFIGLAIVILVGGLLWLGRKRLLRAARILFGKE